MDSTVVLRRFMPVLALAGTVGLLRASAPAHDPAALAEAEARLFRHVTLPMTHRFVQAGRHQIHTVILGAGPPLVMLHGHGGGVGVWLYNLDLLGRHFRVYALDWLGWGRSDRPRFTGQSAEAARDWWLNSLEDWRRAVGLDRFILFGHSLGGWVAAEYAMAFGRHVSQLILENPAGLVDDVTLSKSWYYCVSPQRMIQALGPLGPRLVEYGCAAEAERCPYDGAALLDYYYHLSCAPLSGQIAFERILTPLHWRLPIVPRADQIHVPTTILWGEKDELLAIDHGRQLAQALPRGRLIPLPDAYHSAHSEAPEPFHEAFLRGYADCLGSEPDLALAS